MPRGDTYSYRDARQFSFSDGRPRPGFMFLYRAELAHLVGAHCTRAAIVLYLYIGTHVSGVRDGFRIGGGELQRKLNLNRSTLYKALRELADAGLIIDAPPRGDGITRLELTQVEGEPWPTKQQLDAIRHMRRSKRIKPPADNSNSTVAHERPDLSPMGDQSDYPLSGLGEDQDSSRACGDIDNSSSGAMVAPRSLPEFSPVLRVELPPRIPGRRIVSLAEAVWRRLLVHSRASDDGDTVFDRAARGDRALLADLISAYIELPTRSAGTSVDPFVREKWLLEALVVAGETGVEGTEGWPRCVGDTLSSP